MNFASVLLAFLVVALAAASKPASPERQIHDTVSAVASEVAKIDAVLAGLQAEREAGSGARDTAELREELQGLTHRLGGKAGRAELLPTLALDLAQTLT